jgi:hypothetical protein
MSTEHQDIEEIKNNLSYQRTVLTTKYYCNKSKKQRDARVILLR